MHSSLLLMVLLTALFHSAAAWAETTPAKGSIDSRIRVAAYDSAEVYRLRGLVGYQIDLEFEPGWIDRNKQAVIEAACGKLGINGLKPLKDALPPEITYDEIRLVVARVRREQRVNKVDVPA